MEIINKYSTNYTQIVNYLNSKIPDGKKIWYQKHMAHHILNLNDIEWITNFENCILLRHPKEVISSYSNKNKLNSFEELGYKQQYEIIRMLKKKNKSFIIIDSSELLQNPEKILNAWCKKIYIKYEQSMLKWEKGNHINDGIWWKSWYDNVIKTTGFQRYKKKDINIESEYDSIYNESMKYYTYLKEVK
jgi:squalene cyclase